MKYLRPFNEESERSFKDIFKQFINWELVNYFIDISTHYTDNNYLFSIYIDIKVDRTYRGIYIYNSLRDKYVNGDWTDSMHGSQQLERIRRCEADGLIKGDSVRYSLYTSDKKEIREVIFRKLNNKFPNLDIQLDSEDNRIKIGY